MKKFIILFALVVMCVSCEPIVIREPEGINKITKPEVIIYDSCEYITYRTSSYFFELTHKGNCKYCEERQKKLLNK